MGTTWMGQCRKQALQDLGYSRGWALQEMGTAGNGQSRVWDTGGDGQCMDGDFREWTLQGMDSESLGTAGNGH